MNFNKDGRLHNAVYSSFSKNLIKAFVLIIVFFIFIMPVLRLVIMSFIGDDGMTSDFYRDVLSSDRTWTVLSNTAIIVILSTLISSVLGIVFAWLIAYTDIRAKNIIQLFIFLPFIIPSYIISLAWVDFFGGQGTLNTILEWFGMASGGWNLYSFSGIIVVMGISHFPLVYLFTVNVFRRIPREMEHAARASGAGRWHSFKNILIPMALPGIASGTFIAFLGSLDNFGTPAFLGIPGNITVLSTYIYQQVIGFGTSSFNYAAVLSVVLGVIAVIGLLIQWFLLRKSKRIQTTQLDMEPRYHLGRKKYIIEFLISLFFLVTSIFPLLSMASSSFLNAYGLSFTPENLSLDNFEYVMTSSSTYDAIMNSLKFAGVTAGIGLFIGTFIAYIRVRKGGNTIRTVETAITIPYALPGTVLALAMIFTWINPIPRVDWNPGIYGSAMIMYIAYFTRFLLLQVRGSITAFQQVDIEIEEAAQVNGSKAMVKWRKILIPLILPGVLSGTVLVFLTALTELTVSALLYSSTSETIGVSILSFQQSGYSLYANAFSTLIVLTIIVVYLILFTVQFFIKRKVKSDDS
ncbi:ABC transporter permease [Lacicoccus qingdaonensis]|uniref:Iron(III) transport system permease protein n=1 Tax=Lacicoccus qingdaonensis TaxID=576118 RepID=A0A1G9BB02_9BACL|nr:iron ABC transporter permease [Salinicoccus qingdaonensis]SDK36681.1 iron(III) transport system permease protein [Salinicoccus qingdaonensis]